MIFLPPFLDTFYLIRLYASLVFGQMFSGKPRPYNGMCVSSKRIWIRVSVLYYAFYYCLLRKRSFRFLSLRTLFCPGNIPRPNRASTGPAAEFVHPPQETKILHCCFLSPTIPFIEMMPGITLKQLLLLITVLNQRFLHGLALQGNVLILKSAWVLLNHLWRSSCFLPFKWVAAYRSGLLAKTKAPFLFEAASPASSGLLLTDGPITWRCHFPLNRLIPWENTTCIEFELC